MFESSVGSCELILAREKQDLWRTNMLETFGDPSPYSGCSQRKTGRKRFRDKWERLIHLTQVLKFKNIPKSFFLTVVYICILFCWLVKFKLSTKESLKKVKTKRILQTEHFCLGPTTKTRRAFKRYQESLEHFFMSNGGYFLNGPVKNNQAAAIWTTWHLKCHIICLLIYFLELVG